MAAIITENFRRVNAKNLVDSIKSDATNFYVGLGRSNSWPDISGLEEDDSNFNVPDPLGTFGDNTELLNNLTTLIGITSTNVTQVIPKVVAKVNQRHKEYDPYNPDCFYQTEVGGIQRFPCYTIVNDNVYLCLRESNGIETSYSLPDGNSRSRGPVQNADGSVWLYIYSILSSFPINGTQFVTVPSSYTLNDSETGSTITTASGNLVYGFSVIDGGTGYASAPVVKYIDEDGNETLLTATISGGSIVSVKYSSGTSPFSWVKKRGYVTVSSGTARIYPKIAPVKGFGFQPTADLNSWYTGIKVNAAEEIEGDGAYVPYRQISVIKNPQYEVGTDNIELSLNCLKSLNFGVADDPTTVETGAIISQSSTGAIGIADYYDETRKKLYYHQTYDSGFIPFDTTSIEIDSTSYTPTSVSTSEYKKETGEVIFAENRKRISRTAGQTEEISIILQF